MLARSLREQPAKDFEFNRASLRDVLRFLATDAGISYISVPEVGATEDRLVTFSLRASPFRALEIIAKANGVALFYEDDIWFLRPYNDKELIARIYKIKYNTQEEVKSDSAGASAPQAQTGAIGGSGTSAGTAPDLGLSLQGVTDVFKTDPKQLVDDIKALLGIPTTGTSATNAGEVTVDATTGLPISSQGSSMSSTPNVVGETNGPQAIWNSDSNTLYVVATRQQQQWVEGYLQSMDRPQVLIAIEVKFLETNRDPKEQLGIDWSGTLQDGFTLAARNITASPNGSINVTTDKVREQQYGALPPGQSAYDYNNNITNNVATFGAPYSAILSASDVAVTLRAFLTDRDSSQVSYPRVLTRNNREVVIRSVINQPVLASSSSVTPGIGGTTTASISYLPIGTIINVLPKQMSDGSIALSVSISISNILRQEPIAGNLYPVASTRVFKAALSVTSGYTVAIGGLEEAKDEKTKNGVPFLKDIPLLGEAFKSSGRNQEKKNLILFITPTLLPANGTSGIAEKPVSTLPVTPGAEPSPPAFTVDGALVGGAAAIPEAVRWLDLQQRYYREIVRERRFTKKDLASLKNLVRIGEMLIVQIELAKADRAPTNQDLSATLDQVIDTVSELENLIRKGSKTLINI
jgi:Flp pilus assembly secretin CpaC